MNSLRAKRSDNDAWKDPKIEPRIYVFLPEYVYPSGNILKQPLGRQAAQGGHVLRKMGTKQKKFDEITTIYLHVRDQYELGHVIELLQHLDIKWEGFLDKNEEYGPDAQVLTAVATYPVYPWEVAVFRYLHLWGSDRHLLQ